MRITLRTKFIILTTVLVTIIMASVTYFFTIRELATKRAAIESQIKRIAQNIATMQLLDNQDWSVYQNYISQLMAFNEDIVYIAIYDDRNSLRAHTLNSNLIELERSISSRRQQARIVQRLDNGAVAEESLGDFRSERVNIQAGDRVLGSVHLGFSVIDINQDLQSGIRLNIVLALFYIVFSIFLSILLSRRLTRPLERLSKAMAAVNEGDLSQTVEPETHDEIAQLTHSFNDMTEGLRERQIIENLGYELSASFQFDRLGPLVKDRLSAAIGAADARLYIKEQRTNGVFQEITSGDGKRNTFPPLHLNGEATTFLKDKKNGFMIRSAPEWVLEILQHQNREEDGLVIPMLVKEDLFALLFFELPHRREQYTKKQIHFAATLASQAVLALENAQLYESLREQERIKKELEIARDVQRKLLPNQMPQVNGFQFDAICQPAQEVGGDYYDFFHLDENRLGIVIADVSGHGASASFYMAEIKGMMVQLTSTYLSPKTLLTELNRNLYRNIDRNMFITMIYGVLDISTGTFNFVRAGHNSLLKIDADNCHHFMIPPGIALGLAPGEVFENLLQEVTFEIASGETVVFYTDGLTEAMNGTKESFGEERLLDCLLKQQRKDALKTRMEVLETLADFMKGSPPHDDITMVLLQCDKK